MSNTLNRAINVFRTPLNRVINYLGRLQKRLSREHKTLTIGTKKYNIIRICTDAALIQILKNEGKLNPKIQYLVNCGEGSTYETVSNEHLGAGTFNYVYTLKVHTDKVLRVLKEKHESFMFDEITGLFIQSYMARDVNDGGLGCKNVCKIYEFGYLYGENGDKRIYTIMENLPTSNFIKTILDARKSEDGKKSGLNLKKYFRQLLEGIHCLNSNNYVHLDIKPENFGLDANGSVKIIDFGFARFVQGGSIKVNEINGTPHYMDPNYREKRIISLNSDIYAVGSYFMRLTMIEIFHQRQFICRRCSDYSRYIKIFLLIQILTIIS